MWLEFPKNIIFFENFESIFNFCVYLILYQDSCYKVREKFTIKLHQALDKMQLPLDYLAFFSLAATDPSKERRLKAFVLQYF